jgi:ABC-type multidrug transport system permease subunit
LIGFAIGGVWNNIDCEGFAILERMGLFLTVYLLSSIWMTEFIPSFYTDKVIFYREREVNAITTFTQWVCNGVLYIPLFLFSIFLLTAPIYYLADLRDANDEGEYDPDEPNGDPLVDGDTTKNGSGGFLYHYMIFYVTVYLALITNLTFNFILIYIVPNHMMHLILFPGITLAIQALLSGYSVLPSTVDASLEWIFYTNPCFYYMDSLFVNEFKGNECADSFHNDYTFISTAYSYTIPVPRVLLYTFYMICVQKVMGFFAMKYVNHTKA